MRRPAEVLASQIPTYHAQHVLQRADLSQIVELVLDDDAFVSTLAARIQCENRTQRAWAATELLGSSPEVTAAIATSPSTRWPCGPGEFLLRAP
jgi:hypothetical protein